VHVADLAKVQRERELPTKIIQALQTVLQNRILAKAINIGVDQPFAPPLAVRWIVRMPIVRTISAKLIGYGLWPARLKNCQQREMS
jgi:hypothetical protein